MRVSLTATTFGICPRLLMLLTLVFGAVSPAGAAPITYNVNQTVGVGNVTGFIETDGHIGVLSTADILDWNLLLNDGVNTFDLLGPLSGPNSALQIIGSDLSATSSDLLFNFSGGNGYAIFQAPVLFSGFDLWCLQGGPSIVCTSESSGGKEVLNVKPDSNQVTTFAGTQVVATVPEPASLALLGTALFGFGLSRRRRKARV